MNAIVYSRVSTDAQERDGTSLATQERACIEYAASRGFAVVDRVRDTASGFTLERSGLARVRSEALAGDIDVVLAYALDRLSRKQTHVAILVEEMEQLGVAIDFVTEDFEDTATGQLLRSVKAFAAELEREKIAEPTMRGKIERARSGRLPQGTGRGMYGYTYNRQTGKREVQGEQAAVVRRIFADFLSGKSCNRMANELNAEGIPAFAGGKWHALTVRRLLSYESYTGTTHYRRHRVEHGRSRGGRKTTRIVERDRSEWVSVVGATSALIDRATFEKVVAQLRDPARRRQAHPTRRYKLSGRIRCRDCGAAMVGHAVHRGRYHYYRCTNVPGSSRAGAHPAKYMPAEAMEQAVRQALADLLSDPQRVLDEARKLSQNSAAQRQKSELDERLTAVEGQQRRLVDLYTSGEVPEKLLREKSTELAARRTRLESERLALATEPATLDVDALARGMPEVLRAIREWVASASGDDFDLLCSAINPSGRLSLVFVGGNCILDTPAQVF